MLSLVHELLGSVRPRAIWLYVPVIDYIFKIGLKLLLKPAVAP